MILCDTNILIDYWKNPKELLKLKISKDKHSICGIVKSELLHGAKNDDEADRMLGFLQFNHHRRIRLGIFRTYASDNTHSGFYNACYRCAYCLPWN